MLLVNVSVYVPGMALRGGRGMEMEPGCSSVGVRWIVGVCWGRVDDGGG